MGEQELPGGIASRLSGLTAALISHTLAITALAADETRSLIQRSLVSLILIIALITSLLIAYLALVLTAVALLTIWVGWSWVAALGAAALSHLIFALIIFLILRARRSSPIYEGTTEELRRDFDALNKFAKTSPSTPTDIPRP
jgi:uncharacterized membrane protein YqjE